MATYNKFSTARVVAILFLSLLGACSENLSEKEVVPKTEATGSSIAQNQEQYKPGAKGNQKMLNITLPFSNKAQSVHVEVIDNMVILEGDIVLGPIADFEASNAVAIDGASYRWPSSVIPYVISAGHPELADIQWAINHVNANTNLCLVPRTNQADYVQFVTGSGCSSYVGRRGGRQNITIGGCSPGSVAHEILHAAGLWHEQSREDRDTYIRVNLANVQPGYEHNFNRHVSDGIDIGTYDYGSIMHYGKTAFSRNGLNTIDIRIPPGTSTTTIGQRTGLSAKDKAAINYLYKPGPCKEDCVPFNPANVSIRQSGTLWLVVDGSHSLFSAPNYSEAYSIYRIIKYYSLNRSCFVGRPNPSFQYMLRGTFSPVGAMAGEDVIPFDPTRLYITAEGSQYLMTDGTSRMFLFPNKIEADLALKMIKKYGFNRTGYVGRPGPSLQYMRR